MRTNRCEMIRVTKFLKLLDMNKLMNVMLTSSALMSSMLSLVPRVVVEILCCLWLSHDSKMMYFPEKITLILSFSPTIDMLENALVHVLFLIPAEISSITLLIKAVLKQTLLKESK